MNDDPFVNNSLTKRIVLLVIIDNSLIIKRHILAMNVKFITLDVQIGKEVLQSLKISKKDSVLLLIL